MTAPLWPDGPLSMQPHELVTVVETWWLIDAERAGHHQHWTASDAHRDRWVRALECAGWQVAIGGTEEHRRFIRSADMNLRAADGGPGGKDRG